MRSTYLLIFLFFLQYLVACSSADTINTTTAEGAYQMAQKYEKDERYEEATTYYREVKNKHPYSNFATLSELAIADIEFKRESYPEAEANYRLFKELHPSHDKVAYVTYRLGLSIFKQVPDTIDRDLADAKRSIIYFDEVILSYPNSEFVKDAEKNKLEAQKMLAEKQAYVANFYFIREFWQSALGRYKDLLTEPAGLGFEKQALYGAAVSAYRMKELDQARGYLAQLKDKYPKSSEYNSAKEEILNE